MLSSLVNDPVVRTFAMEAMKQFINKIGKSEKKDIKHDVEEIKRKIEEEFKKNEIILSQTLNAKDAELENTRSMNEKLQNRVRQLKAEVSCQQKEESVSMQLLKDKENMAGKIEELERELSKMQALKALKELEAEKAKSEFLEQKKSNEELAQKYLSFLLELNLDLNKESSDVEKTKLDLQEKFDALEKISSQKKQTNKPKKKKPTQNEKPQESKEPEPKNVANFSNMPGPSNVPNYPMHNPAANMNYHNIPGPSNIPYHNIPGPSNIPSYNMPQNMPNLNMPPNMPNFNMPPNMSHSNMPLNSPYMSGPDNYNNRPHYNPNSVHSGHSSMPQYNTNFTGAPLQMRMPTDKSASPSFNKHPNISKPNQLNIEQKPNNLQQNNQKQYKEKRLTESNKKKVDKKQSSEEKKETDSADKSKSKSVPTFDLWDELDKLKDDIKNKGAVKSELMSKIPNMMAQASGSTITSKEKYMVELSECIEEINKLPDSSSNQTRRNFNYRGRGWRGGYRNFRGQGNRGRSFSSQGDKGEENDNQNSDGNNCSDDDNLSLCSEPPYQRNQDGSNYRGRRFTGQGNYRGNKQFNQNAVDKDAADSDDAASVSSENQNYNRNRGGSNYRGRRFTGQGNNRDNYQNFRGKGRIYMKVGRGKHHNVNDNYDQSNNTNTSSPPILSKSTSNIPALLETPVPAVRSSVQAKQQDHSVQAKQQDRSFVQAKQQDRRPAQIKNEDPTKTVQSKDKSTSKGPVAYANKEDIFDRLMENKIPTLLDAIAYKWDLTMKVKNITMVAVVKGKVVHEKPQTLLDIIQFKDNHSDAVCVPEAAHN